MILIDTNVLVAYFNRDDALHKNALEVMQKIDSGTFGPGIISDYVFDEAVTVCSVKVNREEAVRFGNAILQSFQLVRVTEPVFRAAWWLFKGTTKLSFTDCVNIALVKELEIENLATFDKEFKKAKIKIIDS